MTIRDLTPGSLRCGALVAAIVIEVHDSETVVGDESKKISWLREFNNIVRREYRLQDLIQTMKFCHYFGDDLVV